MKIGVLSDLHIDGNKKMLKDGERYVDIVAELVHSENVDLMLIAGDISNDYKESLQFLHELEQLCSRKVLFVPGNHDYWSKENGETDTWKIYNAFKSDKTSILEKPYIINDEWAIVGNSGWYDYTFGNSKFTEEDFRLMTFNNRTWQDKLFVKWDKDNLDMHRFFYEKIEQDLQSVGNRKIILMTHFVTHPHFIVPPPAHIFEYFNAFLGSNEYGSLYESFNIKFSIMGHVHYRKKLQENNIEYICACLGNAKEWFTADPVEELKRSFAVVEI